MEIRLAQSDEEILGCFPVIAELRPPLRAIDFVGRVRAQQAEGYRLAFATSADAVVAVAGFRIGLNLAWGRFLYVDDLATAEAARSRGFGRELLLWLRRRAEEEGCVQVHLDSGVQRVRAHRFYEANGFVITSHHFRLDLENDVTDP